MNITKLAAQTTNPTLFAPGTDIMWTDPHIAKQLLQVHLNPDLELASRRKETIDLTVEWILNTLHTEHATILDLGCGPGLYCQQFAERGHEVTGVDFSENSIAYATETAAASGLPIAYKVGNYCDIDLPEEHFDCITLVYTDFGVLHPDDQEKLLGNIRRWLKPGGLFIFDLLSVDAFAGGLSPKNWEISEGGFWREGPFAVMSETVPFEDAQVILSQHVVFDESDLPAVYRFWTQYFTEARIDEILKGADFTVLESKRGLIPDSDFLKGENLIFTVAQK